MQLQNIYIYPIKSLGGIRLEEAILEERGLRYDRRWMLVDRDGVFLSQRKHPKMALLQTAISGEFIKVYLKDQPEMSINIPFDPISGDMLSVSVWDDTFQAQVVDYGINHWFSDILGFACSLMYMPDTTARKVSPKYAVNHESVSFADAMPYLLIGQASLDDLNSKLVDPVPMDRFRPNLVFTGGNAYEEDQWDKLQIGEAIFKITKPCARCVMTAVDQSTGTKGKEPLKTLSTYRLMDGKVMFGQNMLLLEGKKITVRDNLTVI